jgi:UDP-glucose 4-epimerase
MVVPRFVKWALAGEPIRVYGDGQQTRCFANVLDVVDAIHRLSETTDSLGQVFNIGSGEEVSILQLAERVIDRTDSPSTIQMVPYEEAYEPGFEDFRRRVPSIEKIKQYTGWQPTTPLDQTIDQMIAYYKEYGLHG